MFKQEIRMIKWLYAMWLAKRFCKHEDVLYSHSLQFFEDCRPFAHRIPLFDEPQLRVVWPDAWMAITPDDVKRAIRLAEERKELKFTTISIR